MNHPSLRPLQIVIEQAERQRDEARSRRSRADAALQAAEQQQRQLADYQRESEARWLAQFRQGAAITLVQVQHDFVGRLQGAVAMQAQQVERLRRECERVAAAHVVAEQKLAAVRKLADQRAQVLLLGALRREQKQMDELAARAGQRPRAEAMAAATDPSDDGWPADDDPAAAW
jgi:flagellar FliJ protein